MFIKILKIFVYEGIIEMAEFMISEDDVVQFLDWRTQIKYLCNFSSADRTPVITENRVKSVINQQFIK